MGIDKSRLGSKGEIPVKILLILVSIILVTVFVPLILDLVSSGDASVLECSDPEYENLSASNFLCYNGTNPGQNVSASQVGFTGTERTVLELIPLFLVIGALVFVAIKVGIFGKN